MKKKKIYEGKIIGLNVYDLTIEKRKVKREIIEHPGAAAMLAFDEKGKIILVKQHRFGHGYILEIPAGTLHKMCKTALKKSLRISPRIMCIDITGHWKYSELLKDIFGKRLISLEDMDSASKFVVKEFRKMVSEVMR